MANEYLRPTTSSATFTNSANAYDGTGTSDNSTYASCTAGDTTDVWSGFPSGSGVSSLTLHIVYEITATASDDQFTLEYSLDGGTNWETPVVSGVITATTKTDWNTSLSTSQDLTNLQVRGFFDKVGGPDAGVEVRIWEIYTDGVLTGTTISDTGVTGTLSVNAPTISTVQNVTVVETGVSGTFTVNSPTIIKDIIYDMSTFNTSVSISDTGVSGTFSVNDPTVSIGGGSVTVVETGVTGTFSINAPTISTIQNVSIAETGTSGTFSINTPTVSAIQNVSIADTGISGAFSINTPTITGIENISISDTGISSTLSISDPTIVTIQNVVITDGGISANFTPNAPIISVGGNVTISEVGNSANFAINAPTVSAIENVTISETGISATFTVNAPTVSTVAPDVTIVDTGVQATLLINTPTVSAIQNVSIADTGNSGTFSMNSATISITQSVLPSTVSLSATLNSPNILLAPPNYNLTENLVIDGGYLYVYNSSSTGAPYNGKLTYTGDGTEAEGNAWIPTSAEYPKDGTINLSENGDGKGSKRIETDWIPSADSPWVITGIYNVVMGVSYDMYSIHYKGDNTCDIYKGNSDTPLALYASNVSYTPPTTQWIITENPPSVITVSSIVYDMGAIPTPAIISDTGNSITATINDVVVSAVKNITVSTENLSLNITANDVLAYAPPNTLVSVDNLSIQITVNTPIVNPIFFTRTGISSGEILNKDNGAEINHLINSGEILESINPYQ